MQEVAPLGSTAAYSHMHGWVGVLEGGGITFVPAKFVFFLPLAGAIPPELGNLAALICLKLERNQLIGESLETDLKQEISVVFQQ